MSNNSVVLQGWLLLQQAGVTPEGLIHAHLDTDKPYLGGRHPVVLEGGAAKRARQLLDVVGPHLAIQAVVHGRLVTMWRNNEPRSAVVARYVDFFGEPKPLRRDTGSLIPPWGGDGSSAYRPAGHDAA